MLHHIRCAHPQADSHGLTSRRAVLSGANHSAPPRHRLREQSAVIHSVSVMRVRVTQDKLLIRLSENTTCYREYRDPCMAYSPAFRTLAVAPRRRAKARAARQWPRRRRAVRWRIDVCNIPPGKACLPTHWSEYRGSSPRPASCPVGKSRLYSIVWVRQRVWAWQKAPTWHYPCRWCPRRIDACVSETDADRLFSQFGPRSRPHGSAAREGSGREQPRRRPATKSLPALSWPWRPEISERSQSHHRHMRLAFKPTGRQNNWTAARQRVY